jgi:hypothetical protein
MMHFSQSTQTFSINGLLTLLTLSNQIYIIYHTVFVSIWLLRLKKISEISVDTLYHNIEPYLTSLMRNIPFLERDEFSLVIISLIVSYYNISVIPSSNPKSILDIIFNCLKTLTISNTDEQLKTLFLWCDIIYPKIQHHVSVEISSDCACDCTLSNGVSKSFIAWCCSSSSRSCPASHMTKILIEKASEDLDTVSETNDVAEERDQEISFFIDGHGEQREEEREEEPRTDAESTINMKRKKPRHATSGIQPNSSVEGDEDNDSEFIDKSRKPGLST